MGKAERNKGANFERKIWHILESYGIESRRGQVFNGEPDIVTNTNLHLECKAQETTKIHEWMRQSMAACGEKIPTVVHKRNREDILITLRFEDFLKLWTGEFMTPPKE